VCGLGVRFCFSSLVLATMGVICYACVLPGILHLIAALRTYFFPSTLENKRCIRFDPMGFLVTVLLFSEDSPHTSSPRDELFFLLGAGRTDYHFLHLAVFLWSR